MGKLSIWEPKLIREFLDSAKECRRWVIPDFVAHEGLTLLSGPRKLGMKTWLADFLAVVCTHGLEVDILRATDPGPVIYFEEEGTPLGTYLRWQGIERSLHIDLKKAENFYYAFRPRVLLDDPLWASAIMDAVKKIQPRMVIYDALTYMHKGDENKTHEMRIVVDTLQSIRACGTACVFLAHTNSAGSSERSMDIDLGVRGSKVILDCYDVHVALRRYSSEEKDIKCQIRQREGSERLYQLRWDLQSQWNYDLEAEEVMHVLPTFTSEEEGIKETYIEELLSQLDFSKGRDLRAICRRAKMRRERVTSYLNTLMAQGKVTKSTDATGTYYRRVT